MADLSSLMQVAPYAGGFMAGQRNTSALATDDIERQKLAALVQGINQQNQQNQVMNPLMAEHQRLQNQGMAADLPGRVADANIKTAQAEQKRATLRSDIEAAISTNEGNSAKAKIDLNTAMGQFYSRAGAYLNTVPNDSPGRRALALQQFFADEGIKADHPMTKQLMSRFSHVPSDKLPAVLEAYGAKVLQDNERFQGVKYSADQSRASHKETTGMNNQTQKELERMRIEAGKYDKGRFGISVEEAILKSKNAKQTAEILEQAAYIALENKDTTSAKRFTQRAVEARQRAAEDARNQGVAQPRLDVPAAAERGVIQDRAGPTATAPIGVGGQGGPAPAGQPQAAPAAAIEFLRKNPGMKAQFDAKYGPGAADKALQGR